MSETYKGACFCGAVEFEVTGQPTMMGYCHCDDCRSWSASPVNGFTMWAADSVTVTQGAAQIGAFTKNETSYRKFCTRCGGGLFVELPGLGLIDVFSSKIPSFDFKPNVHVFYGKTVLPIRDGLPKFKDFPVEAGGSGEMLDE